MTPPLASRSCSFLLILLGFVLAPPAGAQEASPDPSDVEMPAFDGSRLEPATLTYEVTTTRAGKASTGSITITISAGSHEGQSTWRIVKGSGAGSGGSSAVLHLDRSTLRPLAYRTDDGPFDLSYDDGTITGTVGSGKHAASIDTTVGAPVLDDKSLNTEMALAGLSLEEGRTFSLRLFSPLGPSVKVATAEVLGTETMNVPAGAFETYVVSLESSTGGTTTMVTMHLRARAPHYLVKSDGTIEAGGVSITITRELTKLTE